MTEENPYNRDISSALFSVEEVTKDSSNSEFIPDEENTVYALFMDGEVLKSPGGSPFVSLKSGFLEYLAKDLSGRVTMNVKELNPYSLFCTNAEFVEKGSVFSDDQIDQAVTDAYMLFRQAGAEFIVLYPYLTFIDEYLASKGAPNMALPNLNGDEPRHEGTEDEQLEKLIQFFTQKYNSLTAPQKCVVLNCVQVYRDFIIGMLVATGGCTAEQFAKAFMSSKGELIAINDGITEEEEKAWMEDYIRSYGYMRSFVDLS